MSSYVCKVNKKIFAMYPYSPSGLADAENDLLNKYTTDLQNLNDQYLNMSNVIITGIDIDSEHKAIKICYLLTTIINGITLNSSNESLLNYYVIETFTNV